MTVPNPAQTAPETHKFASAAFTAAENDNNLPGETSKAGNQTSANDYAAAPVFVPAAIAGLPQFVLWRLTPRTPKPSKIPHNPYTGYPASVIDPNHWSDLGTALNVLRAGDYNGIGFVFTAEDDFTGVDLDGCRDPQTGALQEWAGNIISLLDSYTEVSPSQAGVKIWIRGTVPGGGRRQGQIEVYSERRFFTLTGQKLHGATNQIKPCQQALDKLLARFWEYSPNPPVLSFVTSKPGFVPLAQVENTGGVGAHGELAAILKKARNAANGDRFSQLYDYADLSDFDGDWSRADYQLCLYLAYWTNGSLVAMDKLFRGSALMREKWDSPRGTSTYGEVTLRLAAGRR